MGRQKIIFVISRNLVWFIFWSRIGKKSHIVSEIWGKTSRPFKDQQKTDVEGHKSILVMGNWKKWGWGIALVFLPRDIFLSSHKDKTFIALTDRTANKTKNK